LNRKPIHSMWSYKRKQIHDIQKKKGGGSVMLWKILICIVIINSQILILWKLQNKLINNLNY
jgi:hypothetical protein